MIELIRRRTKILSWAITLLLELHPWIPRHLSLQLLRWLLLLLSVALSIFSLSRVASPVSSLESLEDGLLPEPLRLVPPQHPTYLSRLQRRRELGKGLDPGVKVFPDPKFGSSI